MTQSDLERISAMTSEIEIIDKQMEKLIKENKELKAVIDTYNGSFLQRAKVKSGVSTPRKKEEVTKEKINKLLGLGYNQEEIAKELKCSRATIWRRLKE